EYQAANETQREQLCNELNSQKAPAKKKKSVSKKITEKAVFEKFDVVEQVKAKPRVKTPIDNVPIISTLSQNTDIQSTEIIEPKEKKARKPRTKRVSIQPKEHSNIAKSETATHKPKSIPLDSNIQENNYLTQDSSAQQTDQLSNTPTNETPKEQKIEPVVSEVLKAKDNTIERPQNSPSKPRRGRAKNDPRNK
ncbi:MAG: hypothetical protein ACI9ES_001926, partial [Oceanospirillaceae bacterium]